MKLIAYYPYRTARVMPAMNGKRMVLPRDFLKAVEDLLPNFRGDNHYVIEAEVEETYGQVRYAFWFHDWLVYFGELGERGVEIADPGSGIKAQDYRQTFTEV